MRWARVEVGGVRALKCARVEVTSCGVQRDEPVALEQGMIEKMR